MPEALFMGFLCDSKGAKVSLNSKVAGVCKSCRSRQELSREYLLATFGVDTAETRQSRLRSVTVFLSRSGRELPVPSVFDDLSGIRTAPRTGFSNLGKNSQKLANSERKRWKL